MKKLTFHDLLRNVSNEDMDKPVFALDRNTGKALIVYAIDVLEDNILLSYESACDHIWVSEPVNGNYPDNGAAKAVCQKCEATPSPTISPFHPFSTLSPIVHYYAPLI